MVQLQSKIIDIRNSENGIFDFEIFYPDFDLLSSDSSSKMSHGSQNPEVMYCVAGGVAIGVGLGYLLSSILGSKKKSSPANESDVWSEPGTYVDGGCPGFTVRKTTLPDGVDLMMEKWDAGSSEPPHSHPGDDMTIVVEGQMSLQFFTGKSGALIKDGPRVYLNAGEVGYVKANRIHDAQYHQDCKLVYVHNKTFGFAEAKH